MDIISLPIEFDIDKIDGRFRIIAIASQRAKDLAVGANPKIKTKTKKVTTLALEETIANAVEFLIGEQAKNAKEEAKKFDYRKLLEEKRREITGEDLSEFEKDLKCICTRKRPWIKRPLRVFSEINKRKVLKNKSVLLGVSGGVAAYKSVELVRKLKDEGTAVSVIITEAAQKFVTPLSLEIASQKTVYTDLYIHPMAHITRSFACLQQLCQTPGQFLFRSC